MLKRPVSSKKALIAKSVSALKQILRQLEADAEEHGIDKGELIGEIRLAQKFLKRPVQTVEELAQKPMAELKERLQALEAELATLN